MSRRAGIGLVGLAASVLFGFLLFGVLDSNVYEHGLNLNLKAIAVVVAMSVGVAGAVVAVRIARRRKRSG